MWKKLWCFWDPVLAVGIRRWFEIARHARTTGRTRLAQNLRFEICFHYSKRFAIALHILSPLCEWNTIIFRMNLFSPDISFGMLMTNKIHVEHGKIFSFFSLFLPRRVFIFYGATINRSFWKLLAVWNSSQLDWVWVALQQIKDYFGRGCFLKNCQTDFLLLLQSIAVNHTSILIW